MPDCLFISYTSFTTAFHSWQHGHDHDLLLDACNPGRKIYGRWYAMVEPSMGGQIMDASIFHDHVHHIEQ